MINSLKIIVLSIFSLAIINSYSQGFSFLNTVTSSSSGYQASIRAVKVDQLGNKYIAGNFDISATIKNTTITGNPKDIFFGKLDPLGNPIWIKTAGGPDSDQAMDIELDNQGGLYMSGLFSSTAIFDGNSVTANQHSANSASYSDNFLVKYDTSGNFQWIKTGASTRNDNNSNVNGYSNNTQNYYGRSKIKFKNGYIYLMASNRVSSNSPFGGVGPNGRKFDGLTLPYTQAPGGGGFYGYEYINSFILKTDVNGTNIWLTPIYCNTNQDFDALFGLDFEVNSNNHVIAQYYYSSNGCKIGGQSSPTSITSFSTPSANFPRGALMILELDGSGFYNNVYKLENALSSFNSFFGFGNALNYLSFGLSVDNLDNVYFAFNNYLNDNFNQIIAGINIPENTNTLVKLNSNFVPYNCNLLNTFPSQSQNSFPISALEIKNNQLIFGGILDGTINLDNNTFSRSDEITFVNMDTNLNSVNWVTSTTNSSVLQVDGSGGSSTTPETYSLGIYDLSIGNENQAVFCGNIGPQYRSFGDYTTATNQLNDAFLTEIIPCSPVFSQILPLNPVICGAGNSATLNANVSSGISYTWVSNGISTSSSNTAIYTTTNVGDFSLITDSLGCKDTSNIVNVNIAPLPNVTVPQSTFTACFSGGPTVVQAGNPTGGVWSGLGMVNDSVFDPTILGPGPSLINYTYTNAQGCSDDAIRIANTVQTPPLILSNNLPSFCEGDGPYSLGATVNPSGGNYSGPGVSGTTFNPVNAGVGTHLIRYKYSVAQNCEDSVDFYLVVNASPTINYPDYDSLCDNISSTPLFSASPFGGTYSGPFVIGNNFYPFFSGAGSFPITYTVTENGCTSSSTKNIHIDANINVQLNSISDFCINDAESVLDFGFPTGGNYKIDGISKISLKPAELGIGTHTIEYELINSCGTSIDTKTFEIFGLPNVSAGTDAAVCIGESVILSGTGASTYTWDNSVSNSAAFIPTSTLIYSVIGTDINGCTNTDSLQVTVNDLPNVNTGNDTSICDGQSIALNASGAQFYNWDNNITNATAFTPTSTTSYTVTGTDINGCINTAQVNVTVNSLPSVDAGQDLTICDGDSVILNATGAFIYSWDNNVTNAISFLPTVSKTYTVIGTDVNGCNSTDNILVTINTLPNVDAGTDAAVCIGESVTLNGIGASTYIWDNNVTNAAAFSPTSTLTYRVIGADINGCINTDSIKVTVNDLPNLDAGNDTSICDGESLALTASGALTYNWDNNITNATAFTPISTTLYTVTGTDNNSCINTDQVTITINNNPLVSLSSFTPICNANSSTVPLTGGFPTGGNYNGLGVSNNNFSPSVSGAGFHNISYTYIDSNGCSSSDNKILVVDTNNVNISVPSFGNLCENADSLVLSGGSPSGGFYSGNSVNNNVFYPDSSGSGSFSITYSYLEANTCIASTNSTITVSSLPIVTQDSLSPICLNNSPFVLNGRSPAGGFYSGNGISNGIFNPQITGIGNFNINYIFTDSLGCTNNSETYLTVKPLPTTSLSSFNDLCIDTDSLVVTSGLPVGGSYSGNGVNNGIFYPDSAGTGNHTITYTGELNGCFVSDSQTITVNPLPTLSFGSIPELCVNDSLVLNFMSPLGGIFSGNSISNGIFYSNNSNLGINNINYTYTDINSCTNNQNISLIVNDLTNINSSNSLKNKFCLNDSISVLNNYLPIGGTYFGNGISNNLFDPSLAGVGQQLVNYEFIDSNGCLSNLIDTLNVNALPIVNLTSIELCENSPIVALNNGLPTGGTYSGIGISNGFFDPININPGNSTLTYLVTDSNNCSNFDTSFIKINPNPIVSLNLMENLCRNEGLITLNGGHPSGGNYSGSGVSGNIINTTALNTGMNYVTYSYTDTNSCSSSSVDSLNILQEPTISISGDSILCFGDTSVVSAIGGLNYLWSNGDTSNTTTSLAFNSFFLSATVIDSNGCQNIDSIFITVNDLPQVTINAPDTLCSDSLTTINVVSSANQFLWNNNNTNAFIEIGPFNNGDNPSYFVTAIDSNGCYNSDSTVIIIENCDVSEVHDLNNMEVNVYPNPNNGFFTIELNNHLNEEIDITFISSLGQIVNQQKFNSNIINFNAPYLSSGIYSLIIKSKNQYLIKKVTIQ
jgi:hypothetical protein